MWNLYQNNFLQNDLRIWKPMMKKKSFESIPKPKHTWSYHPFIVTLKSLTFKFFLQFVQVNSFSMKLSIIYGSTTVNISLQFPQLSTSQNKKEKEKGKEEKEENLTTSIKSFISSSINSAPNTFKSLFEFLKCKCSIDVKNNYARVFILLM